MERIFITITGLNHYFGVKLFERDMVLNLEKDLDNEYDKEAIMAKLDGLGKVGYVANSVYSVLGESHSAGRIYDKFDSKAKATVLYKIEEKNSLICELVIENSSNWY